MPAPDPQSTGLQACNPPHCSDGLYCIFSAAKSGTQWSRSGRVAVDGAKSLRSGLWQNRLFSKQKPRQLIPSQTLHAAHCAPDLQAVDMRMQNPACLSVCVEGAHWELAGARQRPQIHVCPLVGEDTACSNNSTLAGIDCSTPNVLAQAPTPEMAFGRPFSLRAFCVPLLKVTAPHGPHISQLVPRCVRQGQWRLMCQERPILSARLVNTTTV
jgi:hypothetical protein